MKIGGSISREGPTHCPIRYGMAARRRRNTRRTPNRNWRFFAPLRMTSVLLFRVRGAVKFALWRDIESVQPTALRGVHTQNHFCAFDVRAYLPRSPVPEVFP